MQRKLFALRLIAGTILMSFTIAAFAHDTPAYSHDADVKTHNPDWMSKLKDDVPLSQLSIPGTHDTMSFYGGDIVQTQSLSLDSQLESGVRVLDIRCRHIEDIFAIHHGSVFQNAYFGDVLNIVTAFLKNHPGESVLMRVSEEYNPENNTRTFDETFRDYYWKTWNTSFWKGNSNNPTLGEIRGKIVVLQKFPSDSKYGVDYDSFEVQDEWYLETNWKLYDKWTQISQFLSVTQNGKSTTKYMNNLSAAGGSFPYFVASGHSNPQTGAPRLATGRTTPGWKDSWPDFPRVDCFIGICTIAFEGTNVLTYERLNNFSRVGILMADFPGPGLIEGIIKLDDQFKK
jgi:1-phosphatidylinositol phosphodiesterase